LINPPEGRTRTCRTTSSEEDAVRAGEVSARDLFFRYSSKGALVSFADQVLLNANDLENKWAKRHLNKSARKREKKSLTRRRS